MSGVGRTAAKRRRQKNSGLRKGCGCPRKGWTKCTHPWSFNFSYHGVGCRISLERQVRRLIRTKTKTGDDVYERLGEATCLLLPELRCQNR